MGILATVRRWLGLENQEAEREAERKARRDWAVRVGVDFPTLLPVRFLDEGRVLFLDVDAGVTIEAGSYEEVEEKYAALLTALSGGHDDVSD